MTDGDREWVMQTVTIGIVASRKEMLEKDVPTLINWHFAGCPIGKRMCVLLGGIAVMQVVLTAGVALVVKLL